MASPHETRENYSRHGSPENIHQRGYGHHHAPLGYAAELHQAMVKRPEMAEIGRSFAPLMHGAMSNCDVEEYQKQTQGPLHAVHDPCPFFALLYGARMNPDDSVFQDTASSGKAEQQLKPQMAMAGGSPDTIDPYHVVSLTVATNSLALSTPCTSPSIGTHSSFQGMSSYNSVYASGSGAMDAAMEDDLSLSPRNMDAHRAMYMENIQSPPLNNSAGEMCELGSRWTTRHGHMQQEVNYNRSRELPYPAYDMSATSPPSPMPGRSIHGQASYLMSPNDTAASYSMSSSLATSPMVMHSASAPPPPLQRTYSLQNTPTLQNRFYSCYPYLPPDILAEALHHANQSQHEENGDSQQAFYQQQQQQQQQQQHLQQQQLQQQQQQEQHELQTMHGGGSDHSKDLVRYQDQQQQQQQHRFASLAHQQDTPSYQALVKFGQEHQQRLQMFALETHSDDESTVEPTKKRRVSSTGEATTTTTTTTRGRSKTIMGADKSTAVATAAQTARRHSCYLCAKLFTRPFNLRSHILTHTNTRPFLCEMATPWGPCTASFTRRHDMIRHQRAKHPAADKQRRASKKDDSKMVMDPIEETNVNWGMVAKD